MGSRNYCFTLNNYSALPDLDCDEIQYAIYQEEVGENGTPHIQGYLELKKPMRFTQVATLNNYELEQAHFEKRRGTATQAINYCKKKDDTYIDGPYEFGEHRGQGSHAEIKEFAASIKSGMSRRDLFDNHPQEYLRYSKMVDEIRRLYAPPLPIRPIEQYNVHPMIIPKDKCILLVGPTSIGKTSYALSHFKNPLLCTQVEDIRNLESDHDGIIFDDLSFQQWPAESRIKILDRRLPSTIHLRYSNFTIPPSIPRVFISNKADIFIAPLDDPKQAAAIRVRYVLYQHQNKLF